MASNQRDRWVVVCFVAWRTINGHFALKRDRPPDRPHAGYDCETEWYLQLSFEWDNWMLSLQFLGKQYRNQARSQPADHGRWFWRAGSESPFPQWDPGVLPKCIFGIICAIIGPQNGPILLCWILSYITLVGRYWHTLHTKGYAKLTVIIIIIIINLLLLKAFTNY